MRPYGELSKAQEGLLPHQFCSDCIIVTRGYDSREGQLVEGANAPLGTFSARIEACYALGLTSDDEHNDLTLIRRIRNEFAHNIETTFGTPSIVSRCSQLRLKAEDYGDVKVGSAGQFQTAAISVITNLINRPQYVSQERRVTKVWPY
jgi:mannitol operon repressor